MTHVDRATLSHDQYLAGLTGDKFSSVDEKGDGYTGFSILDHSDKTAPGNTTDFFFFKKKMHR